MRDSGGRSTEGRTSDEAGNEIVVTRVLAAPPDVVFEAFTRPQHLERWWGPRGFTTTTHGFEFAPGGGWRFTMHGPDGRDYPNQLRYEEIASPERIVYVHEGGRDGVPARFRATVTFAQHGDGTRLTMRSVFASTAERDAVVAKYDAVEGGKQTLGRLAEYLRQVGDGTASSGEPPAVPVI